MKKKFNNKPQKTWLPIFSGFYESIYEPDYELEAENLNELGYKGEVGEDLRWSDYKLSVARKMCEAIESNMEDFVSKIEFETVRSPREYNFDTDAVDCIITPKAKAIRDYIYAHKAEYEKYLLRYKSRDGFMSFYDHTFEDWKIYTFDFKDYRGNAHYLGSVLQFIAENEKMEEADIWYYDVSNRVEQSEYFSDKPYKMVWEVQDFVRENYTKSNLLNLLFERFDTEVLDVEKIMLQVCAEIESHVLTLEFPEPKKKKK